ncbi:DNA mismatch repair protein MutT [Catellatospora sp. TT07R-123]|uniref:NUDIX hydrolase n=1 Tax=Catellatospora sp. TT07R-123 TaxID=2733863 RepID=UPI001B154B04|nr:NUDIX domain-containing protein [Catellatospora sp. TT07R-123]GHJ45603.1 DNA mismatch repair protein MutT [Catellatospora sp. TT07R-123]
MTLPKLRHSARAIVLDPDDRILLCRFDFDRPTGPFTVWATPGGGLDPGETLLDALHRELREETGLVLSTEPPHVWHQVVVQPGHANGHDGVINDYFLVRAEAFTPRGAMTDAELADEHIFGWRWWSPAELGAYTGPAVFSPRDMATLLAALLADGVPAEPVPLGL